jgi:hypothetical protein
MVSFTPRPLFLLRKSSPVSITCVLGKSHYCSGNFEGILPLPGIESLLFDRPAHILVTIPTELHWLCVTGLSGGGVSLLLYSPTFWALEVSHLSSVRAKFVIITVYRHSGGDAQENESLFSAAGNINVLSSFMFARFLCNCFCQRAWKRRLPTR